MKTVNDMRVGLGDIWEELRNKTISHKEADSFANIAGKMTKLMDIELKYHELRVKNPSIKVDFIEE